MSSRHVRSLATPAAQAEDGGSKEARPVTA